MQIRKKRKLLKKPLIITGSVVGLLLVVTIAGGVYLYKFHGSLFGWQPNPIAQNSPSSINYKAPTPDQQAAGSAVKQQSLTNQTKGTTSTDQPPAPVAQPNGQSIVQVTITAANQTTSVLQVRAQVDTVTNNGTCTLTLTKAGSTTVTQAASTQSYASISACKGFDVPLSQLPAGTWNLAVHFSGNNLVGDASQSITIH